MRRILVLGNGFDLAHDLPTQYKDFLYSCSYIIGEPLFEEKNVSEMLKIARTLFFNKLKMFKIENDEIKNNSWNNYFYLRYTKIGENWIDFESEINEVCDYLTTDAKTNKRYDVFVQSKKSKTPKLQVMIDGLNSLIKLLDCYLSAVNELTISKYYQQIIDFMPTDVLTLNYTNTFENVYNESGNVCYTHGELSSKEYDEKGNIISEIPNKIVLGFNSLINKKSEEYYYDFLKYYQMVNKDVNVDRYCKIQGSNDNITMFFGHSLDQSDESFVRTVIDHSEKVFILYHNDSAKAQRIRNLTKIFGRDLFEKYTLTDSKKIYFIKQDSPKIIEKDDIKETLNCINKLFDFCQSKNDDLTAEDFINIKNRISINKLNISIIADRLCDFANTLGPKQRIDKELLRNVDEYFKNIKDDSNDIILNEMKKEYLILNNNWSSSINLIIDPNNVLNSGEKSE